MRVSESASIAVQPEALLVTADASVTIERLNGVLAAHRLELPIAPLRPGLSLADLVAQNAGGRRHLRHGTIARYLRAATLADGLELGGPTLKRATGYALQRALLGGWLAPGPLASVTLSVRPLATARAALLLPCAHLADATRLSAALLAAGLALSALAVLDDGCLLAELEGHPAVVARQAERVATIAASHGIHARPGGSDAWSAWEQRAAGTGQPGSVALNLLLPRAALPQVLEQADRIARRYRLELPWWGDAGVGTLHLHLVGGGHAGEAMAAATLISQAAITCGGASSTEHGGAPAWPARLAPPASSRSPARSRPDSNLATALAHALGADAVVTRPNDLVCYTRDASIARASGVPVAAVFPRSTAEVAAVLEIAASRNVPVVARGAGSGLAGGTTPVPGALVLGLSRMQQITVDAGQQRAHVEAGAITAEIGRLAEAQGLFYPPDPSSLTVSTIGGNLACNAGGPRCLKYGVTSDYVLGLTAVLADGRVVHLGDGLAGQSADAGLMHLLIGSEGTLAIITGATLRLLRLPPARRTAMAIFDRLEDASRTVEAIMAAGILPAGLELMDDTTIDCVAAYLAAEGAAGQLPRGAGAVLLMLSDGEPEAVADEILLLAELAQRGGAREVRVARSAADEAILWRARRSVSVALNRRRPNRLGEDICVPVSQVAEAVRRIKAIGAQFGLPIPVFGHAGDGNLHPNILFDQRDEDEVRRSWLAAEAIFGAALDLGGTLSGEHGVGTLKRPFMDRALSPGALALQRDLKARFDPHGILNPGRLMRLHPRVGRVSRRPRR